MSVIHHTRRHRRTLIFFILTLMCCANVDAQRKLLFCEEKKGCSIASTRLSAAELEAMFRQPNLLLNVDSNALLVINGCTASIEKDKTAQQVHQSFGGQGNPGRKLNADLRQYLSQKGCAGCPNNTQRISFLVKTTEHSGSGYFFANLQSGEAYMPNASFQQFYAGTEGFGNMTIDAFFRDKKYVSYVIDPEGKKYRMDMAIGTDMKTIDGQDLDNQEYFKKNFKATGRKRPHLNSTLEEVEYSGQGEEGPITFWLAPAHTVCLPPGQFDAFGFFNLGHLAIDGVTYLVCEISGPDFQVRVTGVQEGSYQFNPAGYVPVGTLQP